MAEYGEVPELSNADLAALDLIIAEMEEKGMTSLGEAGAFTTIITPLARTVAMQAITNVTANVLTQAAKTVTDATAEITANTPEITPVVAAIAEMPAAGGAAEVPPAADEILKSLASDEITLERLIAVREELRKG